MLTKFETKSNRVKGLAFHPSRPWVLASLHNGCVQLWDYRMGTLVGQWTEHEGPVRGCVFHPTQPLFATGGDDAKVRVFNWQQRKCLFVLSGHHDYIRSIAFHHEMPWILTASDDQTIRVWNWQSRQCIAQLTGHSHYVMCAQFHPRDDLVVSASLDQTIRVWDISGIRRKGSISDSSAMGGSYVDRTGSIGIGGGGGGGGGPLSPRSLAQIELFSGNEGNLKFILEGHDRGVNWVQFHPTKPLIISGSDDRSVKLWRYNESRAWETDTFRGHFNNVSCVLFHPRQEMILSNSEDKTIRVWDIAKKGSPALTFRREHDRYWTLTAHPTLNLFAAGHDNGLVIFKLERERPAFTIAEDRVLYIVRDHALKAIDLKKAGEEGGSSESMITSIDRKLTLPAIMSFNPAERIILLSTSLDSPGSYDLLPISGSNSKKGHGSYGIFTSRNRFAVLDAIEHQIQIKSLDNSIIQTISPPEGVERLLAGSIGHLWMAKSGAVLVYELQSGQVIAELPIPHVKYAVWSFDMKSVALLSKKGIAIVKIEKNITNDTEEDVKFFVRSTTAEQTFIKSAIWDGELVYYTNANHLKYLLPNGDSGVVCTISQPLYLARVKGDLIQAVDRETNLVQMRIDPTEAVFKLALIHNDFSTVMHLVRSGRLLGQSIIAYLRRNGHSEIALEFVKDPLTRLELALECCNLKEALEAAQKLDKKDCWNQLAEEAIRIGDASTAEIAYKNSGNLSKLAFLYVITGNQKGLQELSDTTEGKGDPSVRIQCQLWLGDSIGMAHSISQVGLEALAFQALKGSGSDKEAHSLAEAWEKTTVIHNMAVGPSLSSIEPIYFGNMSPWPLTGPANKEYSSHLSKAMYTGNKANEERAEEALLGVTRSLHGLGLMDYQQTAKYSGEAEFYASERMNDDMAGFKGDWDDELDIIEDVEIEEEDIDNEKEFGKYSDFDRSTNFGKQELTPRDAMKANANLVPYDHFIAGSIDTGIQLLNRQVGIVNLEPLQPIIEMISSTAEEYWKNLELMLPGLESIYANPEEPDIRKRQGRTIIKLANVQNYYDQGRKLTTAGKFSDAIQMFENALQSILFLRLDKPSEYEELVQPLINSCREYLIGLKMEMMRKEWIARLPEDINPENLDETDCELVKGALELACYFGHCDIDREHLVLAIKSAMTFAYRLKCIRMASKLARRLVDMGSAASEQVILQARKVIAVADKTISGSDRGQDPIIPNYDPYSPFTVDMYTWKPVPLGNNSISSSNAIKCPYCSALYHHNEADDEPGGRVCKVCMVARIGQPSTGLVLCEKTK